MNDWLIDIAQIAGLLVVVWVVFWVLFRLVLAPETARWLATGITLAVFVGAVFTILLRRLGIIQSLDMGLLLFSGMLLGINLVLMPVLYWWDKRKAQDADAEGNVRIPEVVLHTFAFLGGGLSAVASQRVLRHKTRKRKFQIITWVAVVANVGMFYLAFNYFQ